MPLSKRVAADVTPLLEAYCRRKIPAEVRDRVRLTYEIRGNSVFLVEERPDWQDRAHWRREDIAKFRYDSFLGVWQLYWADRNSRWHRYEGIGATPRFHLLLDEVDRDPTCIFWG